MKNYLFFLFFLPLYSVAQEQLPVPEVVMLYKSDLVVDAYLLKTDSTTIYAEVIEVLTHHSLKIKKGQRIRIRKLNYPVCGSSLYDDSNQRKRARIYLQQEAENWKLYELHEEALVTFSNKETYFSFRTNSIHLQTKEFAGKLREFYRVYQLHPKDTTFSATCPADSLKWLVGRNPLIRQFEEENRSVKNPVLVPVSEIVPEKPILSCSFLETPPQYKDQTDLTYVVKEVQAALVFPQTTDPMEGSVIVSFIIEANGTLGDIALLRGLREDYDRQALVALQTLTNWKPAYQNGKPVACQMNMPVKFKLPEK